MCKIMKLETWKTLSPEEQALRVTRLDVSPYTDLDLFKEIEREFLKLYGNDMSLYNVQCRFGSGLGPYNGIFVTLLSGAKIKLPKIFLGFQIEKKFIKNTGYSISFHDLHYLFKVASRYQLNNVLTALLLTVHGHEGNWIILDSNKNEVTMEELFQKIKGDEKLERQIYGTVMSYAR